VAARVERLAECLCEWQWPDGGWNCDPRPEAHHSSFHESLTPLWGLAEFAQATEDAAAAAAAERAAELLLRHRLFRSDRTGDVISRRWLDLRHPVYWHYHVLQGLEMLRRTGKLADPRTRDALDLIE
jgi:hypothetical protein